VEGGIFNTMRGSTSSKAIPVTSVGLFETGVEGMFSDERAVDY
jgi:hypothetical protein